MTVCALMLAGCFGGGGARKDPLADAVWSFGSDAVMLEIVADPGLNAYQDQPHTLLLGIYEAADAQAFRDLVADSGALAASLAAGKAPQQVVQLTRHVVSPGQHSLLILDRAQNARAVGLVAGYAQTGAAKSARQFDIPLNVTSKGWIFKTHTAAPGPLVIRVNLGAQNVVNAQVLPGIPDGVDLKRARPIEGGKEISLASGSASSDRPQD